ncbi:MAG: Clp protease N-terminal domain-containing protein, partial [Alysiella sp.]|uniref:Clp protease N-terminal domain-containing protein n=1 Tax=Alysiella sp. TaxID=1872483 RepID=UPI0026DC8CCF
MRYDKLTTKLQQALADAQSLALAKDHAYIESIHVLHTLLNDTTSGMGALLVKANGNVAQIKRDVQAAIDALPQVSGQGGEINMSRELQNVFNLMDKAATRLGDTFIATELFPLALILEKGSTGSLLQNAGVSEQSLQQAIQAIRNGQNVHEQNAEDQREALKKYTLDLTER